MKTLIATWFSGTLRIPLGKQLEYVHMGYESIYEQELILTSDKVMETGFLISNTKMFATNAIRFISFLYLLYGSIPLSPLDPPLVPPTGGKERGGAWKACRGRFFTNRLRQDKVDKVGK